MANQVQDATKHIVPRTNEHDSVLTHYQKRGAAKCAAARSPVSGDKRFFDTISVMYIQVKVQHPGMMLQQLKDGQDQVIDIAKS